MKTKSQSPSTKKPSTTLHVVASREGKPRSASDITESLSHGSFRWNDPPSPADHLSKASPASQLTPGLRLAERLRAARNESGLSLEAVSQKSKVALRYVCMFEEGRYPMVADPAYLTYFVRLYAASLGLDESEAAREFIAETEYSPSPLHGRNSPPAEIRDTKPCDVARRGLVSQLMARRMPKVRRPSWSGPASSRRGHPFRPGTFKFYSGPLALIAAVVMVGPFSPLYVWEKTLPSVSETASPLQASRTIQAEATAEASHEPTLIVASPALAVASLPLVAASLPPVAEVAPPSVDASIPTALQVVVPDVPAPSELPAEEPRVLPPSKSSTNKASDALREAQLARMKARAAAAE